MSWNDGLEAGTATWQIASSTNPRIRVLAGPGTGKSYAMKRRVARLLESGAEPKKILPITFTRVAAEDLHRELVGMDVPGCTELFGRTLHSLALRILTRNHVLEATGRIPRPLNEFEREPLVADLKAHGGKKVVRKKILAYEAAWARLQHEEPGYAKQEADALFEDALVDWLVFHKCVLIGEVVPQLYEYLRTNPLAGELSEFSNILVDEYQDLNRAEQDVIRLLSQSAELCVVGDDDQSIYSFKHAHPQGIQGWLGGNPGADDFSLVHCRRCPSRVVEMANSLIAKNQSRPDRPPLEPVAVNGPGMVKIVQYSSLGAEVAGVANIVSAMVDEGVPPGDILVLTQSRAFGNPIYEALTAIDVPTQSYYSEAELTYEDARRSFALLLLLADREDRVALRWLVGLNGSNWHEAGYRRVREHCEDTGLSPWEVLAALASGALKLPYTGGIVGSFIEVTEMLSDLEGLSTAEVVDRLFPEELDHMHDIREIALEVVESVDDEDWKGLANGLTSVVAQPEIPMEIEDVRIMSLHKSKGLSAPVTVIAGCVEGLLPRRPDEDMSPTERKAYLEEQRRLFYVGLTRVAAVPVEGKPGTLLITCSQQMPVADALRAGIKPAQQNYGTAELLASRFIGELGAAAPPAEPG